MLNLKTPQVDIILIFLIPFMLEIVFKFLFGHSWEFYDSRKKGIEMWTDSDMHSLAQ